MTETLSDKIKEVPKELMCACGECDLRKLSIPDVKRFLIDESLLICKLKENLITLEEFEKRRSKLIGDKLQ